MKKLIALYLLVIVSSCDSDANKKLIEKYKNKVKCDTIVAPDSVKVDSLVK